MIKKGDLCLDPLDQILLVISNERPCIAKCHGCEDRLCFTVLSNNHRCMLAFCKQSIKEIL